MQPWSMAPLLLSFALPPAAFPTLDRATTRPALIVAAVSGATYLPPVRECKTGESVNPDGTTTVTICMDPPPFYFKADIKASVYGGIDPAPVFASTTSHYGTQGYQDRKGVDLVLLHTDGKALVMPRYAMRSLLTNKMGQHFLAMQHAIAAPFLPCSVNDLREELRHEDFAALPVLAADGLGLEAKKDPATWLVAVDGGYRPRYAISMERLQAHLAETKPGIDSMHCAAPAKAPRSEPIMDRRR